MDPRPHPYSINNNVPPHPSHAHQSQYSHPSHDRPPMPHLSQPGPPQYSHHSSSQNFAPSSNKQPIQIPYNDPFRSSSRPVDPFLPSPIERRDSYGQLSSGRESHQHHRSMSSLGHISREPLNGGGWSSDHTSAQHSQVIHGSPIRTAQHSTAPPLSSHPFAYDHARRNSLNKSISPSKYYPPGKPPQPGAAAQEHPPPPSFGTRQMPSPSPSQTPSSLANYAARPPPPSFGAQRELPGLGGNSRQGSGMSISSLLGDAPAPSRPQLHQGSLPGPSMRPPSPRRNIHHLQRDGRDTRDQREPGDHREQREHREQPPHYGGPDTPEKGYIRMNEGSGYPSTTSSPRHYAPGPRGSPEFSRNYPASHQAHPTPPRPPQYGGSPRTAHEQRQLDDRRRPVDERGYPLEERFPPRPNSQPGHQATLHQVREYNEPLSGHRAAPYGGNIMLQDSGQDSLQLAQQYGDRPIHRPHDRPPSAQSQGQYQQAQHGQEEHNLLRRNLLGQEPIRQEVLRQEPIREEPHCDTGPQRKEESGGPVRSGFRGPSYGQPPNSLSAAEAPRSHPLPRESGRRPGEQPTPEQIPVYGRPTFEQIRREDQTANRMESRNFGGEPLSRRPSGEEMQATRSFLGISSDSNKRGRASPLPQAVKGVQAQLLGPSDDPSIKSEFGRLFQGLGSGLGGLGNMTPSRQSPVPQRMRDTPTAIEQDGIKMTRMGSLGSRGRKPDEIDDGRRTPLGSGSRGGRKSKQSLHQQIHNQRAYDEDSPTLIRNFSGTPTGQQIIHPQMILREVAPPMPQIPKPTVRVMSEKVLAIASQKQRIHLGLYPYAINYITPPYASTTIYDKYGYCMQYKPARRFTSDDENGTAIIRVPRDYLAADKREKLCVDRYIYGTEIYTDDSDPLLAAIHSGWIRGAWPADVDTGLMDLPPAPPADAPIVLELTAPPAAGPVLPPANMDCHITIVILPVLVEYRSSLRFGMKSRQWGDNHDGCSFMVTGIKWTDEGQDRNVEKPSKIGKARSTKQTLDPGHKGSAAKRQRMSVAQKA